MYTKWSNEDIYILKKYYHKMAVKDIYQKYLYNHTIYSIYKQAEKMLLKRGKKYNCDESFFHSYQIDANYWAGFIAADGCVQYKVNNLKIALSPRDKLQLLNFIKAIKFDGPICHTSRECIVSIYGIPKILKDLKTIFSITERKSLTLQPPHICDENYIRAFIRGYYDGDGSIAKINSKNTWRVSITSGSFDFLNWLKNNIEKFILNIKCGIYNDRNHYQLIFSNRQSLLFLNWLYNFSNKYNRLDRKYDIYLQLKNRCQKIDSKILASKYIGVGYDKSRNKWTSTIWYKNKPIRMGRFLTEKEAATAYNAKAIELGLLDRCYEVK